MSCDFSAGLGGIVGNCHGISSRQLLDKEQAAKKRNERIGSVIEGASLSQRRDDDLVEVSLQSHIDAVIEDAPQPYQFDPRYRLFLTTNEAGVGDSMVRLRSRVFPEKDQAGRQPTALVVSGMQGVNFVSMVGEATAAGRSIKAIIHLDLGCASRFWENLSTYIRKAKPSPSLQQVVSKVQALHAAEIFGIFGEDTERACLAVRGEGQDFLDEVEAGESWLSTNERYSHIRDIILSGQFVTKRVDLLNVASIKKVRRVIQEAKLYLALTYVSNIGEYPDAAGFRRYKRSTKHLWREMDPIRSIQIDCKPNTARGVGVLEQRIVDFEEEGCSGDLFSSLMVQFTA